MNRILIFILVVLESSLNVWSQGYKSIYDSNLTTWYHAREAIDRIDNIVIKTLSDTIIDTKDYKSLDINGIIEDSRFFIREDSTLGKVWIFDLENNIEYLTMDLSLNKGDTFLIQNLNYGQDSVAIVDSVYTLDNRKYVRLGYDIQILDSNDQLTFIEGIGPNASLLYQIRSLEDNIPYSQILLCVYKDDIREYKDEKRSNENCIFDNGTFAINYTHPNIFFSIYPNPTSNFIFFSNPDCLSGIIELYNTSGVLLKDYNIEESSEKTISLSGIPKGFYILFFRNEELLLPLGKIIKYE